jgi:hypothetical protein
MLYGMKLTIPAKPELMLVARMALAGYCSQCGADIDTLDDIRTLSDEACYFLMNQTMEAKSLSIAAKKDGSLASIRFEAAYNGQINARAPMHDPDIAYGILGTLATDIRVKTKDGTKNAIEVDVHLGPI